MAWSRVFEGAVRSTPLLAMDRSIYWQLDGTGLIRSTDQGTTWTKVDQHVVLGFRADLVEMPDGRLLAVGNNNLFLSADHGSTWRQINPALPYAPSSIAYSRFRKAIYAGHWTCSPTAVPADAIIRLSFDYQAH